MKKFLMVFVVVLMGFIINIQVEVSVKYNMYCVVCYGIGVVGVLKIGDKVVWEFCLVVGIDVLVISLKKGKNVMFFMGFCNDCIDVELKEFIEFMLNQFYLE